MKEISDLQKQILGNAGHVKFFTQQEFDEAMAVAQAEIMTVAIETTKRAIFIERQACADLVRDVANKEGKEHAIVLESLQRPFSTASPAKGNNHETLLLNHWVLYDAVHH